MQYGTSGTAFDQKEMFTLDEAARALVFDRTGRYVPALPHALTSDGKAYHDWLAILREAALAEGDGALHISIYKEDREKTWYIQRADFQRWCETRKMRPAFLFGNEGKAVLDRPAAEDDKEELGRRERQIDAILTAAAALEMTPTNIPDGGKAEIKEICLRRGELFTDSGFDHAWKAACKAGKVRMQNDEKFKSKG